MWTSKCLLCVMWEERRLWLPKGGAEGDFWEGSGMLIWPTASLLRGQRAPSGPPPCLVVFRAVAWV
jgi:hypothetical protein